GEELGDTAIRADAMSWRVPTHVALGDVDAARREVAALQKTAEETAQPFVLHVAAHYDSAIALGAGRLDEAEGLAIRSHESRGSPPRGWRPTGRRSGWPPSPT